MGKRVWVAGGARRRQWWCGTRRCAGGISKIHFQIRVAVVCPSNGVSVGRVVRVKAFRCLPFVRHAIVVGVSRRSTGCEGRPLVITSDTSRTVTIFRDQTGVDRVSNRETGADFIEDVLDICLRGRDSDGIAGQRPWALPLERIGSRNCAIRWPSFPAVAYDVPLGLGAARAVWAKVVAEVHHLRELLLDLRTGCVDEHLVTTRRSIRAGLVKVSH